jgi:CubicO group peptidase (beta-lactamase class C family)
MADFHATGLAIPSLARFDDFVKAFLEQKGDKPFRGAVLAITSGDRLVFARGYVLDRKADGIVQPAALFRIASASKPITGVAIHQLFESLKANKSVLNETDTAAPIITLKQPDGTAFKQDSKPPPAQASSTPGHYFHAVTIRQMLTHRTGLLSNLGRVDVAVATAFQGARDAGPIELPVDKYQVASWGVAQGQGFWPDDAGPVAYSNLEYSLLGMVIEKKTGRSYRSAVQRTVLGPTGVSRARIARSRESERAPGEATYHIVPEEKGPSVLEPGQPTVPVQYGGENFANKDAFGGWVMSAVDYARFLTSFGSARPLVKSQVADLLFWWLSPKTSKGGVTFYRHGASLPGSEGVIGLRKDGFSISLLLNSSKEGKRVFEFEGTTYSQPANNDHEIVLHAIVDELKANAWPAHDLFPLHGVPANVTDAVAIGGGTLFVAIRGADQALHTTARTRTGWTKWKERGGELATPPRLVSWGAGHLGIFALGLDRALWHRERLPGKSFGDWKSLGGDLASEPSAVCSKPSRVDVFALGKDHDLRHYRRDEKKGWGGEESLGGSLATPPSAVAWGPDKLEVFALGTSHALYHITHDPKKGWSKWKSLGGDLRSYPEAISWGEGRLDVFALGPDRSLMHLAFEAKTGWGKWKSLGGDLRCSPAVTSWGAGRLDVFALTAQQELTHISFAGAHGWSNWQMLGGTLTSRPKAVSPGSGRIDVLAAGLDQAVWLLSHVPGKGKGWGSWKSIGGEVG